MAETKPKCPKCHKDCKCLYVGDVNSEPRFANYQYIVDEYRLICSHCGYEESRREDGGQSGYLENATCCPFCGKDNLHHPR